jgi:hypothetical protein
MTQQNSHRPTRRAARAGRNRPELVTSTSEVKNDARILETDQPTEEATLAPNEQPVSSPSPARRLADFFSTVGRSGKSQAAQETEVAQARIARASRGKASVTSNDSPSSETRQQPKASAPARTTPARPASPFKTKYLLGIAIYLFGAQFIGIYERQFLIANHLEAVLGRPFGFTITTSTVVYLATLLVLLLILARLDLVPRSLGAMSGQQSSQSRRGTSQGTSEDNIKSPPPTMKQGVKGEDDDLYQEYRSNQRRAKKR